MAIRFLCPNCKKVLSVKDEFAGKKGKCPHCQKGLLVPTPSARPSPAAGKPADGPAAPAPAPPKPVNPAPPPSLVDAEAEAAAALADEPKPEDGPPPTTIDFNCPMCDAALHLPLSEAGTRRPCPECKRIIKVPEPAKRDPTDWRRKTTNLPSGAKREVEAAPEGAWGSAAASTSVSREALQEAGAVPTKKAPVPLSRRIVRYLLWSAGGGVVLVLAVLGYLRWRESRAEQGVAAAVAYAETDGKAALGAGGQAAIYRLAGEYALRSGQPGDGKRARDLFEKSLSAAKATDGVTEHDALLQDLAFAEVELGGKQEDVDAGRKAAWEDVLKDLRATLTAVQESEPKQEALRAVARRLAEQNKGDSVKALAHTLFSSTNEDQGEALGVVGLELCAVDKKDLATAAWNDVKALYAGKDRPPLAPAAVALAVVLGQPPPEAAKKSDADAANASVGRAEGLAHLKQWDAARQTLSAIQGEALLRANVALADADLDDKASGNKDVDAAFKLAPTAGNGASSWLLVRLTRIGERAKVAADSMQPVAAMVPDPALRGRAQLDVLRARLADPKQVGDPKLVDAVDATPLSAWLARAEWARRNTGSTGLVKGWDGPNRVFGLLGLALGVQGGD